MTTGANGQSIATSGSSHRKPIDASGRYGTEIWYDTSLPARVMKPWAIPGDTRSAGDSRRSSSYATQRPKVDETGSDVDRHIEDSTHGCSAPTWSRRCGACWKCMPRSVPATVVERDAALGDRRVERRRARTRPRSKVRGEQTTFVDDRLDLDRERRPSMSGGLEPHSEDLHLGNRDDEAAAPAADDRHLLGDLVAQVPRQDQHVVGPVGDQLRRDRGSAGASPAAGDPACAGCGRRRRRCRRSCTARRVEQRVALGGGTVGRRRVLPARGVGEEGAQRHAQRVDTRRRTPA